MGNTSDMDRVIATIMDIAMPGDAGVAKVDNLIVFVPGALPGDRVAISIVKREKRFGHGELIGIEEASPFRIQPSCPHFSECGGCTIQSMQYQRQLILKESHLKQCLKRIGKLEISDHIFDPIIPSPEIFWYRGKMELSFGSDSNGRVVAGMRRMSSPAGISSSSVVPVPECRIFSRNLKRIIAIVEDYVHMEGLFPWDDRKGNGILRHLVLRESKHTGQIMAIIETKSHTSIRLSELYYRLKREVPEITSVYRAINDRPGSYIDYSRLSHEGGNPYIQESVAGIDFWVYPASFFQPNPAGASLLYQKIEAMLSSQKFRNILGLYCGIAPIELILSRISHNVIGIDSLRENIDNARKNAALNNIGNCMFTHGKVEDMVFDRGFTRPDFIVVDPPRSGITHRGIDVLLHLRPRALIYVSCNPATGVRDLARLVSHGYSINHIVPFDLFPHTSHLETLVLLDATKGKS